MHIGPHVLANALAVAPMAGVTDRPFRQLCKRLGAGYAVSEMVAANPRLWATDKSRRRTDHEGEVEPVAVQIAGADPSLVADAARYNVDRGAQIIDINLGCPAKKVCNTLAGSALLSDEPLVARIVRAVVAAVAVPVTLKLRTGPHPGARNAVAIARMAQDEGIAALALHGRTRACAFVGAVEYETIAAVKQAVRIPVFANGDIRTPAQARDVLARTGADGLMIGRAAQGRPWIFREIAHHLATGGTLPSPTVEEARSLIDAHLCDHYGFYGEALGVRIARKHLGWYTAALPGGAALRAVVNHTDTAAGQRAAMAAFFDALARRGERLCYLEPTTDAAGAARDAHASPRARPTDRAVQQDRPAARPWAGEALAA
ncbi:MAG TPA: tRNA dihydrouridine synthase DusB [Casimicrobiaceae bacterium]|nr:tRNA dihydrouridine synthase DusB [Casimicrobiaceae bacterium]